MGNIFYIIFFGLSFAFCLAIPALFLIAFCTSNKRRLKQALKLTGCFFLYLILGTFCILMFDPNYTPEYITESRAEAKAKKAEAQAYQRKVKLKSDRKRKKETAINNSIYTIKNLVKNKMRNPKSFEAIDLFIKDNKYGTHQIILIYRGQNGFGGYSTGEAIGTFDSKSGDILSIEHIN